MQSILTGKDNTSDGFGNYTGRSVYDTSLHWAYSLHGYEQYTIEEDGVPIVPHVHGGHTKDFSSTAILNFSSARILKSEDPRWKRPIYRYDNDQPAGTVWYHDHALGITRLNVYAGMAGFYIIRDDDDTGKLGNPLDLPAFPYEAALAIQDKMFKDNGELFYPAFPGDPFYADFITEEGADTCHLTSIPRRRTHRSGRVLRRPHGGQRQDLAQDGRGAAQLPAALTQRLRQPLPGSAVLRGAGWRRRISAEANRQLDFTVIGSDQGLASDTSHVDTLVMETGSRYDIIFDFNQVTPGNRVIMKNIGGTRHSASIMDLGLSRARTSFVNRQTDRIMAFDVNQPFDNSVPDVTPAAAALFSYAADREAAYKAYRPNTVHRVRKVALFEGTDEFGRLQPILGTAEPATDYQGKAINWPKHARIPGCRSDRPNGWRHRLA